MLMKDRRKLMYTPTGITGDVIRMDREKRKLEKALEDIRNGKYDTYTDPDTGKVMTEEDLVESIQSIKDWKPLP